MALGCVKVSTSVCAEAVPAAVELLVMMLELLKAVVCGELFVCSKLVRVDCKTSLVKVMFEKLAKRLVIGTEGVGTGTRDPLYAVVLDASEILKVRLGAVPPTSVTDELSARLVVGKESLAEGGRLVTLRGLSVTSEVLAQCKEVEVSAGGAAVREPLPGNTLSASCVMDEVLRTDP